MQDFTGVPAVVDLAAMRDATQAARRRSRARSIRWCRSTSSSTIRSWSTSSARRTRSRRTSTWNTSATASATRSCAGARRRSRISASCRRAPASATRSTSNIWRRRCGRARSARTANGRLRLPRHARRHRLATPRWSTGSSVLGWGVGGIEAEAAMLGQPISMLIPEVIGFRLDGQAAGRHDRDRPRAHRHADAAQEGRGRQVRGVLRAGAVEPDARGSRHHRQHGAGIRRDLRLLPDRGRHDHLPRPPPAAIRIASRWWRPMPRRRACGARTGPPTRLHRHAGARPFAPWCRRSPDRSGRRTASPLSAAAPEFEKALRRISAPDEAEEGERSRDDQLRDRPTATSSSPRSRRAPTPRTRAC